MRPDARPVTLRAPVDTIVVGAGVIGLGIAWRAAQRGRDVLLLDRAEPGGGASFHAAGMLAPITEATFGEHNLLRLNLASAQAYPAFVEELSATSGRWLGSSAPGTLFVALDRDQLEALAQLFAFQQSLGLAVEWLDAGRVRELEPALHPGVRAGVRALEREVNPRQLTAALAAALGAAGGSIRPGAEVARLLASRGAVSGVELTGGEQIPLSHGGSLVLAAGCWSGGIGGVPDTVNSAVRPVKGQILRMRPRPGDLLPIRHLVRTEEVYLVPRADGELVVGATVEEQGFDAALTGGGIYELLRAAIEAVPGVRELELTEASVGLRPGSKDNAPLLGPAGPEGLVVATGHHRNGILLTPITAEAIATVVTEGRIPDEIRAFSPGRFG
ncbi:MAG: glycine oxidase ThiO [Actinomycetota bacterium]